MPRAAATPSPSIDPGAPASIEHLLDRGLAFDARRMVGRRRALTVLGGAGLGVALAACGSSDASSATTSTTSASGSSGSSTSASSTSAAGGEAACAVIPEETAGPFPGDGSNGPDVLSESGVVRSDVRSSFGDASGTAEGVELALELTIVEVASGCDPLPGAAVYIWHCDADGGYSLYSQGLEDQNYLRGVQVADDQGRLSFTTVFPGAYLGRWPHIHFEVYRSLDDATGGGQPLATSQIALPNAICASVYETSGYEQSARNFPQTSLEADMVFSDGVAQQLPTVSGDAASVVTAALTVAV